MCEREVYTLCKHPPFSDGKGDPSNLGALVGGTKAPEWGLTPGCLGKADGEGGTKGVSGIVNESRRAD